MMIFLKYHICSELNHICSECIYSEHTFSLQAKTPVKMPVSHFGVPGFDSRLQVLAHFTPLQTREGSSYGSSHCMAATHVGNLD